MVQKQGTAGCTAQGRRKGCVQGRALRSGYDIAISPDGRNIYASTENSIAIFDRDAATGDLTQPAGAAGCITTRRKENPTCASGRSFFGGVAISPDGLNVYVGGLAVFDRDPTTGALTQKPGAEEVKPGAGDAIVSPDGKNVYAVITDGVETFDRDPAAGALTRVPGRAGCVSEKGKKGCRRGHEFSGAFPLSISPDGRNVYGATSRGLGQGDYGVLMILDRLPDGTLAQKKGRAGCFAMFGGEGEGCARTESISEADDTTVSADGKRVYVFNQYDSDAAIFFRHPSGRLAEGPGD
jgi:DNA-binding beta-propeller fold protein YncE